MYTWDKFVWSMDQPGFWPAVWIGIALFTMGGLAFRQILRDMD